MKNVISAIFPGLFLFICIILIGCKHISNEKDELVSCYYIDNDRICIMAAKDFELIKKVSEDSVSIDLLYKCNNDSVAVNILKSNYYNLFEPPKTNIGFLPMCCLDSFSFYRWRKFCYDNVSECKISDILLSIPIITNDYFVFVNLITVEILDRILLFKNINFHDGINSYIVSINYESYSKINEMNAKIILDGFTLKSVNNKKVHQLEMYLSD